MSAAEQQLHGSAATTPIGVVHRSWQDVPREQITGSIGRQYITSDHVTIARFELTRGGVVPRHEHPNEQVSCVLSGRLRFRFGEGEALVGAGETIQIAGGIPHEVEVVEDAIVIDVFSPIRQDWLDHTDTYFRR